MQINAKTFIKTWEQFSEYFTSGNSDWLKLYDNNSEWTLRFLGGKKSCTENSPIGNFFARTFSGLRYRTEDGTFDLAFSLATNYTTLPYLHKTEVAFFGVDSFYPTTYDVIIEVENDCRRAWQEMTKLTWVRSPLKVLITYNWHPFETTVWRSEAKILIDTFSNIIKQSNQNFKDNPQTEYLLIVGNNGDSKLNWAYQMFDSNGTRK